MKRNVKFLALALCLVMLTAALSGCGLLDAVLGAGSANPYVKGDKFTFKPNDFLDDFGKDLDYIEIEIEQDREKYRYVYAYLYTDGDVMGSISFFDGEDEPIVGNKAEVYDCQLIFDMSMLDEVDQVIEVMQATVMASNPKMSEEDAEDLVYDCFGTYFEMVEVLDTYEAFGSYETANNVKYRVSGTEQDSIVVFYFDVAEEE